MYLKSKDTKKLKVYPIESMMVVLGKAKRQGIKSAYLILRVGYRGAYLWMLS
jgi:hypothetical protein